MPEDLYARLSATYTEGHAAGFWQRDELDEYEPLRRAFGELLAACPRPEHDFRVLDAGCGAGRYFHLVPDADVYVGQDISCAMLGQAKSPYRAEALRFTPCLVAGDLLRPAFRDAVFDLVFSIGVFGQELPLSQDTLTALLRLVRPGGSVVLSVLSSETGEQRIPYYSPMSSGEVLGLLRSCGVSDFSLKRLHFSLPSIAADEVFHGLVVRQGREGV